MMKCCSRDQENETISIHKLSYQRWWRLVGGLLLELVAGSVYGFGSFSHQLSENLGGLSDNEIEFIAVCGNVGMWTNIVGSIIYNQVGVHATIIGGSGMVVVGYAFMYLAISSIWPSWVVGIIWFFVGHGSGWLFVAAMFNNAKNFDTSSRGLAVGLLAAHFGMSSSLFVSFISSCFGGTYVIKTSPENVDNIVEKNTTAIDTGNITTAECEGGFVGNNIEHYMLLAGAIVLFFTITACALGVHHKPLSPDILDQISNAENNRRTIYRLVVLLGLTCAALATLASMNIMSLKFPTIFAAWGCLTPLPFIFLYFIVPLISRKSKKQNLKRKKFLHSPKELGQPFIADSSDDHLANSHDGHDAQSSHDAMSTEQFVTSIAKLDKHGDKNNTITVDNVTRSEKQTHTIKFDEESYKEIKSDDQCDKNTEKNTSIAAKKQSGTNLFLILRLCLAIVSHSFTVSGALLVINMISKIVAVREISSDPNLAHVIGALALTSDAAARIVAGIMSFRFPSLSSRTLILTTGAALQAVGQLVLIIPGDRQVSAASIWGAGTNRDPTLLILGCVMLGLADGTAWSVMPSIYMEIFPGKHSATFFCVSVLASAVMSVVLGYGVEPVIYNSFPTDKNGMCTKGIRCFVDTHWVTVGFGITAVLAALVLTIISRRMNK